MNDDAWIAQLAASSLDWDRRANESLQELSDEEFNWRPDAEKWSIAQQIHHLVLGNAFYVPIIEDLAKRAQSFQTSYKPGLWGKLLLMAVRPGGNLPGPVPKEMIPSSASIPKHVLLEFNDFQSRFHVALSELGGRDLNGRFTSPFAKYVKLKLGDALQVVERHNARHLGNALELLDRPDFPNRT